MRDGGVKQTTPTAPPATVRQAAERWGALRTMLRTTRPLAQRFLLLSVLNFLAAGVFFLTQTTIANAIGRTQFGIVAYGIALGVYGQCFVDYGQERTLVRDLVQHPDRFSPLVIRSLWFRVTLLGLLISGLLAAHLVNPTAVSGGIIIIVVAYALKSLDLQAAYDSLQAMGRHAAYLVVQRALYAALIVMVLWRKPVPITVTVVGVALLLSQLVYLVIQYRWVFRRITRQVAQLVSLRTLWDQARNGAWICVSMLLYLTLHSLTQILLQHYAGPRELGGYAAAWQITMFAVLLIQFAVRIGGPRMAEITQDTVGYTRQLRFLLTYGSVIVLLVLPITGVLLWGAEWVLGLCYSAEYRGAAAILHPMGIYTLLLAPGVVLEQFIIAAHIERAFFLAMLCSGLVCVGLNILVIPRMGGYGAGWVLVLAYSTALAVYLGAVIAHLHNNRRREACRPA